MCVPSVTKAPVMKYCFLLFLLLGGILSASAQQRPYNVVFDLTSGDTADHKSLIRWMTGILAANPEAKLQVVLYGQALGMVLRERSTVQTSLAELVAGPNVSFTVCAQSLRRLQLDKDQLLPGVTLVPDGIFEIVQKQGQGWGYIKVTH